MTRSPSHLWFTKALGSDQYHGSWALLSHGGEKVSGGQRQPFAQRALGVGDVVGVEVDADEGTIAFYINGVDYGVAFAGISTLRDGARSAFASGLHPAVALSAEGDAVEVLGLKRGPGVRRYVEN